MRINFNHHQKRLVEVGEADDMVNRKGGSREVFSIADDEQLIGCELDERPSTFDETKTCFVGVTWLKIKLAE